MRRSNIISNAVTIVLTLAAIFGVAYVSSVNFGGELWYIGVILVCSAIVAGLINAIMHECGHLIFAKMNGFKLSEMVIWFCRWSKRREKIYFSFTMMGEQAGYTETFPKTTENLKKRYALSSLGGLIGSFICMIVGVVPLFLTGYISFEIYAFWAMLFPLGAYYFFGNALPVVTNGVKNDGAVIISLIKDDDDSKVMLSLLAIQAQLFDGKTPSEIDEKYYFDLPQLAEDNFNFILLLNARYAYYLDKEDYENAKAITKRLLDLEEYMPRYCLTQVKVDALYNACTFNKNEGVADELTYELQKYLNKVNNVTSVRVKTAYTALVKNELDNIDEFYDKWIEEAENCVLEGQELFEKKLLERVKSSVKNEISVE